MLATGFVMLDMVAPKRQTDVVRGYSYRQIITRPILGGGFYYWWNSGMQFWLYTLYDKDEMADLTPQQRKALRAMLKSELESRRVA